MFKEDMVARGRRRKKKCQRGRRRNVKKEKELNTRVIACALSQEEDLFFARLAYLGLVARKSSLSGRGPYNNYNYC